MRVVFDSNIFISAFILPRSNAEKAICRIIEGRDNLIISKAIIDEVLLVLAGKFSRDIEEISRTAVYLSELAEIVTPGKRVKALKDDPDNRVLECAAGGKAEVIVTGDKEMLGLKQFKSIRIMSLAEYLEMD